LLCPTRDETMRCGTHGIDSGVDSLGGDPSPRSRVVELSVEEGQHIHYPPARQARCCADRAPMRLLAGRRPRRAGGPAPTTLLPLARLVPNIISNSKDSPGPEHDGVLASIRYHVLSPELAPKRSSGSCNPA